MRRASAARSLLRNVRVVGGGGGAGGGQEGECPVTETELYRHFDVGACAYFTSQTADVPSGHFVFVRQGKHGALSLVIVVARAEGEEVGDARAHAQVSGTAQRFRRVVIALGHRILDNIVNHCVKPLLELGGGGGG